MRIAIVVPAYNIAPYLADAIQSVLAQTHADWMMVVVDDGSTDGSAAVASRFPDPRIRIVRQPNAGVSAARNTGIATAMADRPDAFLFFDGDDRLAPGALACLAAALAHSPQAVAAIGRVARIDPNGAVRLARAVPSGDLLAHLLTRNLFANGGHLLIRGSAVEEAGPFLPALCYGEDWEYWVRLALTGSFVTVSSSAPLLFVRERLAGAYLSRATNPESYRPALRAIYANPSLSRRFDPPNLARLARRAEAEIAWTIGRELIRHARRQAGLRWLCRSLGRTPTAKRLILLALAWAGRGPFRPYRPTASPAPGLLAADLPFYHHCD